jgi:hypothetical protein
LLFMEPAGAAPQAFHEYGFAQDLLLYEARDMDNDLHGRIAAGDPLRLTDYHHPGSSLPFAFGAFAFADVDGIYDGQAEPQLHLAWTAQLLLPDTMLWRDPRLPEGQWEQEPTLCLGGSSLWHMNATTGNVGRIGGRMVGPDEDFVFPQPWDLRTAQDRVQLAVDPGTGALYAVWNAFDDGDRGQPQGPAPGLPNGEIYGSCSVDGGLSWGAPVNLSLTPSPDCWPGDCQSETFVSLAETVVDGRLHLSYLIDTCPTCDRSAWPFGQWTYARVATSELPPPTGPGEADGIIGLASYRRPWSFGPGHPDTCEVADKLHLVNDTGQEAWLLRLELIHHPLDDLSPENPDLQVGWDFFAGNPLDGGDYVANPAGPGDWLEPLDPYSVTLLRLRVRHQGLPQGEQAFRLALSTGEERVYRYEYRAHDGSSLVEPLDFGQLESYPSRVLYEFSGRTGEPAGQPGEFLLGPAYPNPFNPTTRLPLTLARAGELRLDLVDLRGATAAVLHEGPLAAGRHEFTVEGSRLASGLYLARLSEGGRTLAMTKMLLVK